jgi:hypothetical protein
VDGRATESSAGGEAAMNGEIVSVKIGGREFAVKPAFPCTFEVTWSPRALRRFSRQLTRDAWDRSFDDFRRRVAAVTRGMSRRRQRRAQVKCALLFRRVSKRSP